MSDPRIAALAAAMARADGDFVGKGSLWLHKAERVLAALPADWCGHPVQVRKWREMRSEIDRLRKIEEALDAIVNGCGNFDCPEHLAIGRAALGEKP